MRGLPCCVGVGSIGGGAMSVGFAAAGRCFPTATEAAAYVCGASFPVTTSSTTVASVWSCMSSTSTALNLRRNQSGSIVNLDQSVTVSFSSCETTDWAAYYPFGLTVSDGLLVGGAVATVWIGAFVWKALRRTLGERDEV